jgi:hypothetical protein
MVIRAWMLFLISTRFSSGIFPISIFGWPDNTKDLKDFYPSAVLETGVCEMSPILACGSL